MGTGAYRGSAQAGNGACGESAQVGNGRHWGRRKWEMAELQASVTKALEKAMADEGLVSLVRVLAGVLAGVFLESIFID